MKNLIIGKINDLTKEDINNFALKEGINLKSEETDLIYTCIKKDYEIILSDKFYSYIENLKGKLSKEVYDKIIELAKKYEKFIL